MSERSPILKTEAIVLRVFPSTNTSSVVVWLTRAQGRVHTLIKGAQRPRSAFLGVIDLFYTCELLYYARAAEDLHHTRECSPLHTRPRLRADWRAALAASAFTDTIRRITPPKALQPGLFELLTELLDELDDHGLSPAAYFAAEMDLLESMGLSPSLDRCAVSGTPIEADDGLFSVAKGGLVHASLARELAKQGEGLGTALRLSPSSLGILRSWQRSRDRQARRRTRLTASQQGEIRYALGHFLSYHFEQPFESRRLLLTQLARLEPLETANRD